MCEFLKIYGLSISEKVGNEHETYFRQFKKISA